MKQPLFSVIIPYFKACATIRGTLDSVLNQTYQKHEVILIDDDSRDNIAEVLAEYIPLFAKKCCSIISIINATNGGPSLARNQGWNQARGDYIAFLDADDEWHPQKLEICGRFLERQEAPVLFHKTWVAPDANAALKYHKEPRRFDDYSCQKFSRYRWLVRNHAATPSIIVRSNIAERFDPTLRFCEDHELWLRIAFRYEAFLRLEGPPLTQLGRTTMSAGGLSGRVHTMRVGEIRMYFKFCCERPARLLLLPFLAGWSIAKYIMFLFCRGSAPKPGRNRPLNKTSGSRP